MQALEVLERWSAAISRRVAYLATAALLLVALMVCAEIFARSILGVSMIGVGDISGLVVAVAIAAAFPAVTIQRGHLVIELLRDKMGGRAAVILNYLGGWITIAALGLLAWRIGVTALDFTVRNATTEVIELPLGPFMWGVTAFIGLAALFQLALTMKDTFGFTAAWRSADGSITRAWVYGLGGVGTIVLLAIAVFDRGESFPWLIPTAPLAIALVFFGIMWIGALVMFPLGAVMLLAGFAGTVVLIDSGPAVSLVATRAIDLLSSDILLIIPLFLLMGTFAQTAGLSTDMYRLAHALMGHYRGGLALATVGACAGFGAMTGSSMATSLTIGQAAYPEMRRFGYSEQLSTGSIAAGGTLGQIVPPSGVIVIYAILTETSVGALFVAAAVPAALVILFFSLSVMIQVRLQPSCAPEAIAREPGALFAALKGIWPSLGLIAVVLGGIYTGIFTVTEAASVGSLGAFLLAFARGRLDKDTLSRVMIETAERTAMVYALIIGGSVFAFFIGVTQLPVEATTILNQFNLPGLAVVAVALVIYILLGMVMEPYAIMIITVPVIAPILVGFDFDLIWWGIIMVMVVEIGLLTPPFGMNCFIIKAVAADVPLGQVFRGVTPFIIADILALALLVLFPALVLWLPSVLL
jgi:C4-dicarboxylate transporter DctM subunit